MTARTYRRRHFLVNRPLQFRFVGALLLFLCVLTVATLGAIYFALWGTLYTFELLDDPVMISLFTNAGLVLATELLVLAPAIVWMGILLTHKIAGPLVRIHAALVQMTQGNFDVRIKLRKGDSLLDLADDVNRLAASLRTRRS